MNQMGSSNHDPNLLLFCVCVCGGVCVCVCVCYSSVVWLCDRLDCSTLSCSVHGILQTSLVAQTVKNLLAMQETWVRSLGQEDSLEKEMATHSSIPAWRIPWTKEPYRLQSMGVQRVGHDWVTNTRTHWSFNLSIFLKFSEIKGINMKMPPFTSKGK